MRLMDETRTIISISEALDGFIIVITCLRESLDDILGRSRLEGLSEVD